MNNNFRIEGLEEVLGSIESIEDIERTKKAVAKCCALVEGAARTKAPKGKTGDLRKFMSSRVEIEGDKVIGIVFNPLEYAPYVEYGTGLFAEGGNGRTDVPWAYKDEETGELIWTSGMPPQPFLRPALEENREEIKRILRRAKND